MSLEVEFIGEWPISSGGTTRQYRVGDWWFDLLFDEQGKVKADPSNSTPANVLHAAEVFTVWAGFLEEVYREN